MNNMQLFESLEIPASAIHRTSIYNWPEGTQLLLEVDGNHDGIFESKEIVSGRGCLRDEIRRDCNKNGIDDYCDIAAGTLHDNNHDNAPDECRRKYTR